LASFPDRKKVEGNRGQAGQAMAEYAIALAVMVVLTAGISRLLRVWIFSFYEGAAKAVLTGWFSF